MTEHTPGIAISDPHIWLQSGERIGRADCGCVLVADLYGQGPGAAFEFCPLHAAAPDLLAALRLLLENAEIDALNETDEDEFADLHDGIRAARLAIARATGIGGNVDVRA